VNEAVPDFCEILNAVGDGHPGTDQAGTAGVVDAAHESHLRVEVIWPPGAERH